MFEELSIGPTPVEETCIPAGTNIEEERAECRRYIERIREHCGPEPEGAHLKVKWNPYDGGDVTGYYDVVVKYNESIADAQSYAYWVEGHGPRYWDKEKEPADLWQKPEPKVYKDQYETVLDPKEWYALPPTAKHLPVPLFKQLMKSDWLVYHTVYFAPVQIVAQHPELTEDFKYHMGETLQYWINWYDGINYLDGQIKRITANLTRVDPDAGVFYHA